VDCKRKPLLSGCIVTVEFIPYHSYAGKDMRLP